MHLRQLRLVRILFKFPVGILLEHDAAVVKLRQRGGKALLQAKLYFFVWHGGLPLLLVVSFISGTNNVLKQYKKEFIDYFKLGGVCIYVY